MRCDAALSWNDGDAIFLVGHLPEKATLLAYFGHQPQPGAGSHLRTKNPMKAISTRTFHHIAPDFLADLTDDIATLLEVAGPSCRLT